MVSVNERVRVFKLSPSSAAQVPTAAWSEWRPGEPNPGRSPPVEYTVTGVLLGDLQEGSRLALARDSRNGVPAAGKFISSPIRGVTVEGSRVLVETTNSVYIVESL